MNDESRSGDTASQVKQTVREKIGDVAGAAKQQAANAYQQQSDFARGEIGNFASALRHAGDQLAGNGSTIGARVANGVADKLDAVGASIEGKDLDEIVRNAESFARRNPAVFFGAAALLGFAASRFLKSSGGGFRGMDRDFETAGYGSETYDDRGAGFGATTRTPATSRTDTFGTTGTIGTDATGTTGFGGSGTNRSGL
jgi:hypothetical protein